MAANLAEIAFQDDVWTSRYEPAHGYTYPHPTAAAEPVHYFLRFPLEMNETFSHFVSGRLLGPIARLHGFDFAWNPALPMILNAFITGLESDEGNDPFDYEQKLPEDKHYEELGPAAQTYSFVFAGLCLAEVTTFVVQTSQSLQLDYTQVTVSLLYGLTNVQRAAANGALEHLTYESTDSGLQVSLCLATELLAVLLKEWIHRYSAVPSGTLVVRRRDHHATFLSGRAFHLQHDGSKMAVDMHPRNIGASEPQPYINLITVAFYTDMEHKVEPGAWSILQYDAFTRNGRHPCLYSWGVRLYNPRYRERKLRMDVVEEIFGLCCCIILSLRHPGSR
ncbi:uncharacterized protein ARMOST_16391 [Armillaria ostoyae]|uniref:DUF6535 domain-containing protein n=1 Tax=Armillaria ostoyae TaxID=47428 RepID=A0A284RW33_ARMOS|nr:uncharacterized protein ARMOST_16391 [Armillaria ostoyae]